MKKAIIAIALAFCFMFCGQAYADYQVWDTRHDVSPVKTWTVRFNSKVEATSISGNVYVQDDDGKAIMVLTELDDNDKAILRVIPVMGYTKGKTNYLYIENGLQSVNGTPLTQAIKMPFEVVE